MDINISPGFANALNYSSNHQIIQQDTQDVNSPELNSPELDDLNTLENEPMNDINNETEGPVVANWEQTVTEAMNSAAAIMNEVADNALDQTVAEAMNSAAVAMNIAINANNSN